MGFFKQGFEEALDMVKRGNSAINTTPFRNMYSKGVKKSLEANASEDLIDKGIGYMFSGGEFAGRYAQEGTTFEQALKDTFIKKYKNQAGEDVEELMWGKAIGGAVGTTFMLRAGIGAARGAFTDGQGGLDVPGIPLI